MANEDGQTLGSIAPVVLDTVHRCDSTLGKHTRLVWYAAATPHDSAVVGSDLLPLPRGLFHDAQVRALLSTLHAPACAWLALLCAGLRISALTLHGCTEHVKNFVWWLALLGFPPTDTKQQLDLILQDYIEQMWDANAGLQAAQATIAGLRQTLKHSVKLRGAWRLLGVWRGAEPPSRAPPMSEQILLAMAMHSLLQGHVHFAMLLLVGFYAFLRTGEIVGFALHAVSRGRPRQLRPLPRPVQSRQASGGGRVCSH